VTLSHQGSTGTNADGITSALGPQYDEISSRQRHRASAIYALEASSLTVRDAARRVGFPICDRLKFDRLEPAYRAAPQQFPVILGRWDASELVLDYAPCSVEVARFWLVALPSDVLLLALTVETACDEDATIALLEDLHHRRVTVSGLSLWDAVRQTAPSELAELLAQSSLSIETYNLLHLSDDHHSKVRLGDEVNVQLVSSLIYRFDEPYSRLSPRICLPDESNRGAAFAATGPYVGITVRNQGYVENAIFSSCLLFVGALKTLRTVRNAAFVELRRARALLSNASESGAHVALPPSVHRAALAEMAQRLAALQLELSCGVEAFQRVASTIPSLRVTDYHEAVFDSASISPEIETIGGILERLGTALAAEVERRQASERQADERRNTIHSVSFGVVAAIALPLGIVFGFFGMTAREIDANRSFMDVQFYSVFYFAMVVLLGITTAVAGILYLKFRLESRHEATYLRKALELD
jgi:hypothetical protein